MSTEIATYDASRGSMAAITGGHLDQFIDWSKKIALGSVIPDSLRGKPADVFITVMHGLDLGLRPMQSLNLIYVVKGRPSLSAEGMRSLIIDAGHELEIDSSETTATVRARRKGTDRWVEASFTLAQAKKAKLGGQNWDAYAEDMLVARATTRLAKRYFPDVTNGLASVEELLDEQGPPAPRPTLAQAAQERQAGVTADPVTGVVDDDTEPQRLREEVAAMERAAAAEPVDAELVPDEALLDETTLDEGGWPETAAPGSRAAAR